MQKRELHNHTVTHPENRLRVYALGERGPNGDNHAYLVDQLNIEQHPAYEDLSKFADEQPELEAQIVLFQQGNPEDGFNGFTIEALLAIAYDRLNGCQAGPYASEHNAQAMISINKALEHLHDRTRERLVAAEQPTLPDAEGDQA